MCPWNLTFVLDLNFKVQRWGFSNRTHARLLIGLYSIRITVLIPMLMFWTFEGIGYIKTTCRFIYLKQDKLQTHYVVFWMCIMLLHYIWPLLSKTVIFNAITFPFIVAKTRRNLERSHDKVDCFNEHVVIIFSMHSISYFIYICMYCGCLFFFFFIFQKQ
jgi:hypothetical protein